MLNNYSSIRNSASPYEHSESPANGERSLPPYSTEEHQNFIQNIHDHHIPGMIWDLETMYGLSYRDVSLHADNPFTRIGFAGKENGLGWTVPHYEEILRSGHLDTIREEVDQLRKRFQCVIFCGVGGAGLGVELAVSAFGQPEGMKLFSLRSTDPTAIQGIFASIRCEMTDLEYALYKTVVVIVSKSGETPEVGSYLNYFESLYQSRGVNPRKHIIIMSDLGSRLHEEAEAKRYIFKPIQLNEKTDIPGRFCAPVTRAFLWPLTLINPYLVRPFLQKAVSMNDRYFDETFIKLGVFLYCAAHFYQRDKVTLIVPPELKALPLWLEPLFEESLGKGGKGVTVIANEALEAVDLRSVHGCDRVFVHLSLDEGRCDNVLVRHLRKCGYPLMTISMNGMDELGGVMLGFQRAVATMAYLWDVNFVGQVDGDSLKDRMRKILIKIDEGAKPVMPRQWRFAGYEDIKVYYTPFIEAGIATMDELRHEVQRLGGDFFNAASVYAAMIKLAEQKSRSHPSKGTFEVGKLAYFGQYAEGFYEVLEDARYNIFTRLLRIPSKLTEMADVQHGYWHSLADGKPMFFSTFILPMDAQQADMLGVDVDQSVAQMVETVQSLVRLGRKAVLLTIDRHVSDSEDIIQEFFEDVEKHLRQYYVTSDRKKERLRVADKGGRVMVRHVVVEPISRFLRKRSVSVFRHKYAFGLL